jgi:hypothetical protein
MKLEMLSLILRLDCLSCVLTVVSTILVGKRCWEGWVLAAANSLIICVIGLRTAQLGFIPANLFCIVLYAVNLRTWRKAEVSDQRPQVAAAQRLLPIVYCSHALASIPLAKRLERNYLFPTSEAY